MLPQCGRGERFILYFYGLDPKSARDIQPVRRE